MRNFRRYRYLFSFLTLLVFCSVMVINGLRAKQAKHIELREAFILLYTKGYKIEADRIYQRLLRDVPRISNKALLDDFQRTLLLVDPTAEQPENLIWKYHWTVSNELEQRAESTIKRAVELSKED
jgi:hypothetical protein